MSFNPYTTTAQQHAEIITRHNEATNTKVQSCAHEIINTPNGRSYGKNGHIPCDHLVVFHYPNGSKEFDGSVWVNRLR